jgi:hypothetical protein
MHRLIFIEFGMLQKKSLANTLVLIYLFFENSLFDSRIDLFERY